MCGVLLLLQVVVVDNKERERDEETNPLVTSTAYPTSQPASGPSFTLNVGTGPFAISVTPSVDLFLGCKSVPAEVTSLTPPLHTQRPGKPHEPVVATV